jgi:hypothetical protein
MARRAYGHGAIYRRADGRWEAQLRLGAGGRKSYYGKTRREAASKLAEASWMIASQLPVNCQSGAAGSPSASTWTTGST